MKNLFILFTAILLLNTLVIAQPTSTLKKVLELKMPKTAEDDMPGTRGACVVWHPLLKKYYAAMAGNADYPLAIFNATGKRLSSDDLTAKIDLRGLWYNPKKKLILGNGHGDNGWFHYVLDPKGKVLDVVVDIEEMAQPNEQSVGTYHPIRNEVMFLKGNQVSLYSNVGSTNNEVDLRIGLTKADDIGEDFEQSDETPEDYNSTTVIYTGIKNAELGILNKTDKQIELYSFDNGFLTKKLKLPDDAPAEPSFNFAYTNGIYWLFNMETRTWIGYK